MDRKAYLAWCADLEEVLIDQPFGPQDQTTIVRHRRSKKWFAAVMERGGKAFVNLKCEPYEAAFLRERFSGVTPGYYMNKEHWISVYFDSDVPDEAIRAMTEESYRLTQQRLPRAPRSETAEDADNRKDNNQQHCKSQADGV